MKIVIDMNLSPEWCNVLSKHGWEACHWSEVGDPRAIDTVIMTWALTNGYVVFTHDLDFGTILATTRANGPSVIQVRTQNVLPSYLETTKIKSRGLSHSCDRGMLFRFRLRLSGRMPSNTWLPMLLSGFCTGFRFSNLSVSIKMYANSAHNH